MYPDPSGMIASNEYLVSADLRTAGWTPAVLHTIIIGTYLGASVNGCLGCASEDGSEGGAICSLFSITLFPYLHRVAITCVDVFVSIWTQYDIIMLLSAANVCHPSANVCNPVGNNVICLSSANVCHPTANVCHGCQRYDIIIEIMMLKND